MLNHADHVFAVALAVAYPLYAYFIGLPRLKRAIAAGVPDIRLRAYVGTIVTQWLLVALLFFHWLGYGRAWAELGLRAEFNYRFGIGLVMAAIAAVAFARRSRQVLRDPARRERFQRAFERVSIILPHTRRELRTFMGVAVTAGVCEEILYRGFLLWYLFLLLGANSNAVWTAVAASSVLFGFAHAYQGWRGIVLTSLIGALEAMLYILTLSLWVPMLLHIAIDVNGGRLGFEYVQSHPPPQPEPPPPAAEETSA